MSFRMTAKIDLGLAEKKPPNFVVEFVEATDLRLVESLWTDLEGRSDLSFFQSWGWIGCWLRMLPERHQALMVVREAEKVVGLALLGRRRVVRHRLIASNCYYLHETGDPHYDSLTVEYNGILAARGQLAGIVDACVGALVRRRSDGWDELVMGGIDQSHLEALVSASRKHRLANRVLYDKRCYSVDLDSIRKSGDYLDAISANSRYQIRRAMRLYQGDGAIAFENARSADEAAIFLDGLKECHQRYWTQRGKPGSFANPFFERFHRQLIRERFAAGEIQLARIRTPNAVIGYLYNFVFRGTAYAYQSGFQYDTDNKRKPGLVSHYLAIGHHLRSGAHIYDFMSGEGQYKDSLSTNTGSLVWAVSQREQLKFHLENSLGRWKRRLAHK